MALTFSQKADCRRHLGVPASGIPTSGYVAGLRTVLRVGQLEFMMANLQIEEEVILTGFPYGMLRVFGIPALGNTVTATVGSNSAIYTVTAVDLLAPIPIQSVAFGLQNAINMTGAMALTAGGGATGSASPPDSNSVFGQVTMISNTGATFTLTASATGGLSAVVFANGAVYPNPQLSIQNPDGSTSNNYGYISICNYLENAIATASANLSLYSAGGLSQQAAARFRQDETAARAELYRYWCKQMGVFLSVGPDPAGRNGMFSGFGATV